MGYQMSKNSSSFNIKGDNISKVVDAIKKLAKTNKNLSYVDNTIVLNSKTIDDVIKKFGWKFKYENEPVNILSLSEIKSILSKLINDLKENITSNDYIETTLEEIINKIPKDRDIIDIDFMSECLGSNKELFDVIAPYVEKDSYIEMSGEEGEIWRWVFDGKDYQEKEPNVSW